MTHLEAFIIGTPHVLQEIEVRRPQNATLENEGKVLLRNCLCQILSAGDFDLIAEEASYVRPYLGRKLAEKFGCEYVNIDLTEAEKKQHGILTSDDVYSGGCTEAEFQNDQLKKDPFMFGRLMAKAGAKRRVLVICGPLHVPGLRERLGKTGAHVSAVDIRKHAAYKLGMDAEP